MKTATIGAAMLLAAGIAPVSAAPITFMATLGPEAIGATGSGSATVMIDTVANLLSVSADWTGLSAGTTVAHIHCCTFLPDAGTVAVAVTPGTFPGFPVGVTSGSYSILLDTESSTTYNPAFVNNFGGGTLAGAEAALLAGFEANKAYFNIHTANFPGGEIRGFLTQVPEPATIILLGAGLVGIGLARRVPFRVSRQQSAFGRVWAARPGLAKR